MNGMRDPTASNDVLAMQILVCPLTDTKTVSAILLLTKKALAATRTVRNGSCSQFILVIQTQIGNSNFLLNQDFPHTSP